jgi:hypothetical protein
MSPHDDEAAIAPRAPWIGQFEAGDQGIGGRSVGS